jgi:hypothetical protein
MILRCACCGLPFARVDRGRVFVVSMHHGAHHTSSISIEELARAAGGGAEPTVQSLPFRIIRAAAREP